jgi:hypothetical protein
MILKFWEQGERDAKLAKKMPLLFMRYNGLPKEFHFVALDYTLYLQIKNKIMGPRNPRLRYTDKNHDIIIITSTELIGTDYKEVRLKVKTHLKTIYDGKK